MSNFVYWGSKYNILLEGGMYAVYDSFGLHQVFETEEAAREYVEEKENTQ